MKSYLKSTVIFYQPISLDASNVLKRAEKKPLKLDGNELKVDIADELTRDKNVLLAENLNLMTSKETINMLVKEDVKIPKSIFEKVKESIEDKRDEFRAENVNFDFDGFRVTLGGRKKDVELKKQLIEAMIDTISEDNMFVETEFAIEDKNTLRFLNFTNYFKKIMGEFPEVQIHEMDNSFGKFSLRGTAEKTRKVQSRVDMDLSKICKIEIEMSDRQIGFLKRTDSRIVNDELKKDDVMLILVPAVGGVDQKDLQAEIMTLKDVEVVFIFVGAIIRFMM